MEGAGVYQGPAHRRCLFGLACMAIVLCSGSSYGWAALAPVLRDEGFFAASDRRAADFALVSTCGIAGPSLCKLPLGYVLDKCGPRRTTMLGGIILAVGALVFACGDRNSQYQIAGGYLCIGMSGQFVQMPCFQFAELFGDRKSVAMSILIACFELSTGVFSVFNLLHRVGVTVKAMFVVLACIGIGTTIMAHCFWPDTPHVNPAAPAAKQQQPHQTHLQRAGLLRQVTSWPFLHAATFLFVHVFRQGVVLASAGLRSEAVFGQSVGHELGQAFSIILPFGFVPMLLFSASCLARLVLGNSDVAFISVSLLSMAYGLLLLVRNKGAYLMAFALFPFARQLMYTAFFTYITEKFTHRTFGRLAGLASTLAGAAQMLLQTPLLVFIEHGWPGSPSAEADRWWYVDLVLGALPVLLLLPPMLHGFWSRRAADTTTAEVQDVQRVLTMP